MSTFGNSLKTAKKSLYTDIFTALRDRIVCLDYPPGTPLNEKDLCEEFGVSRTPLREAIRRLDDLDLVTVIPRFGTHVSSLDLNELRCAMEIKVKLEGLASEAAARRATPEALELMESILEQLQTHQAEEPYDQCKLIAAEGRLHEAIWQTADNPLLVTFLDNLQYRCARVLNSVLVETFIPEEVVKQLTDIVAAIKERDPDKAATLTEDHVRYFVDHLKDKLL